MATDENPDGDDDRYRVDTSAAILSGVLGFFPAVLVFFEGGVATRRPSLLLLLGAWAVFGWLLYRQDQRSAKVAATLFYLALLFALLPLTAFVGAVSANMNVIMSGVLILAAGLAGFGLGAVCYLLSRRIGPD